MKIYIKENHELTVAEQKSIERYAYYTDKQICFACLDEGVMVDLLDMEDNTLPTLIETALNCMEYALSVMPDVWPYHMDDGHHMVWMNGPVVAISPEKVSWLDPELTFALRRKCLDACEKGEIIALVIPGEGEDKTSS
ncbi:MAG: hypothetical protein IKU68_04390 [Oscillospiraceae bacterium]|nr:hypothetical protein [Oscillospiraceae bacterium]